MPPRCPRLTNHDHRIPQVVTGNREVTAVLTVHDNGNWEVCGPDSFRIHGPNVRSHVPASHPLHVAESILSLLSALEGHSVRGYPSSVSQWALQGTGRQAGKHLHTLFGRAEGVPGEARGQDAPHRRLQRRGLGSSFRSWRGGVNTDPLARRGLTTPPTTTTLHPERAEHVGGAQEHA